MKLKLVRQTFTSHSTIGNLYIADAGSDEYRFECFVLEDVVRAVKTPGETAIPEGEYKIVIDESKRFKRRMPRLLDVPGFEGVRIHAGNTAADTEGCLLVGKTKGVNFVGLSRKAFAELFSKLELAIAVDSVTLIVVGNATEGRGMNEKGFTGDRTNS